MIHNLLNTLSRESRTRARTRDPGQISPDEVGKIAITVLIAGVLVFIAAPIFINASTVAATEVVNGSSTTTFEDPRLNNEPDDVGVRASTGKALKVYPDSNVVASSGADLTAGNWSVAATARLDDRRSASDVPRTVASYDNGSVQLMYNDTASGEYLGYYDNGSANATVSIAANNATEFESLVLRWNGSELLLSNGTVSDSAALTTATDNAPVAFDWYGTLEEVRTYNGSLNSSVISGYVSDPVAAYPAEDQGVRLMFDELRNYDDGSGNVPQYFVSGLADVSNVELTDGVDPQSVSEGTDYELSSEPFAFTVKSGGYLEGQPAIRLSYGDSQQAASLLVPIVILGMLLSVLAYPAARVKGAI